MADRTWTLWLCPQCGQQSSRDDHLCLSCGRKEHRNVHCEAVEVVEVTWRESAHTAWDALGQNAKQTRMMRELLLQAERVLAQARRIKRFCPKLYEEMRDAEIAVREGIEATK